ncbi:hypothetical protein Golomagni_06972 [Golovinomyces magnicellulatus]|nr:hypothetical protein Golomagni_06972 [Golovinomyces magnicellulatus]
MGTAGKLSRILNGFLTPVAHSDLPFKAAPGQLTAAEIRQGLALAGEIEQQDYYLFGKPISQSRSPILHNGLFEQVGLPHHYQRLETDSVADVKDVLQKPNFGGASVTIPLKLDVMACVDELTVAAKTIGAVNTIIPVEEEGKRRLVGDNTDWKGMVYVLQQNGLAQDVADSSALVIGSGGTTRAAIFALHSLGFKSIFVAGRNQENVRSLIAEFPVNFGLQALSGAPADLGLERSPRVIISTIPGDKPMDPSMQEVLTKVFAMPLSENVNHILLEMAYKPSVTPVMQMAERVGKWTTIPGLEVLVSQGWYQFQIWTGITPLYNKARDLVMG